MEQIERYLAEIETVLYKMKPIEREHLMEVLRIAFSEHFNNHHLLS